MSNKFGQDMSRLCICSSPQNFGPGDVNCLAELVPIDDPRGSEPLEIESGKIA